jgi:hypothetical protein
MPTLAAEKPRRAAVRLLESSPAGGRIRPPPATIADRHRDPRRAARVRRKARRRAVLDRLATARAAAHASTITNRFGSWNAAVEAAGLAPRRIRASWSDEQLLAGLRRYAAEHGRAPRSTDRVGLLSRYPSPALAISRFGSWSDALRRAGLEPGNPDPVDDQQVIRALRAYRREHRRSPTTTAWKQQRLRPSAEAIIRHCGSWANALALAGLTAAERAPRGADRREIIDALRAYQRHHGVAPTVTVWRRERRQPGAKAIINRFGSWTAALEHAAMRSSRQRG